MQLQLTNVTKSYGSNLALNGFTATLEDYEPKRARSFLRHFYSPVARTENAVAFSASNLFTSLSVNQKSRPFGRLF